MEARDVPVVLGLNPFESPFDVYLRLKYDIKRESPEITASKQLRPLIRDLFLEKNPGYKVALQDKISSITDIPIFAHYDLLEPPAVLITTASGLFSDMKGFWDSLPEYKRIEVLVAMAAGDLISEGYVAGIVGGKGYVQFKVEYDPKIMDQLKYVQNWYLEYVSGDKIPNITYSEYVRYIPLTNGIVELGEELIPKIEQYLEKMKIKKNLERELERLQKEEIEPLKTEIILAMKNCSHAFVGGKYEIVNKEIERKGYYVKPTVIRQFKVNLLGENLGEFLH
jgi:predicted phage-related endonuclease